MTMWPGGGGGEEDECESSKRFWTPAIISAPVRSSEVSDLSETPLGGGTAS